MRDVTNPDRLSGLHCYETKFKTKVDKAYSAALREFDALGPDTQNKTKAPVRLTYTQCTLPKFDLSADEFR